MRVPLFLALTSILFFLTYAIPIPLVLQSRAAAGELLKPTTYAENLKPTTYGGTLKPNTHTAPLTPPLTPLTSGPPPTSRLPPTPPLTPTPTESPSTICFFINFGKENHLNFYAFGVRWTDKMIISGGRFQPKSLQTKLKGNLRILGKPYMLDNGFVFNALGNNAVQVELQARPIYYSKTEFESDKTVEIAEKVGETLTEMTGQPVHCLAFI